MSDFDKEAEREKLREKYGREEEEREATQQMSELLLQGATMTNRHCDECGNPIFRYDGQEFCPQCQREGQGADATGDAEAGESGDQGDPGSRAGADPEPQGRREPEDGPAQAGGSGRREERVAGGAPDAGASTGSNRGSTGVDREVGARAGAGGGAPDDAGDPAADLHRALSKFARLAAETDDPRRAKDHLAAAREAAEALAALRR